MRIPAGGPIGINDFMSFLRMSEPSERPCQVVPEAEAEIGEVLACSCYQVFSDGAEEERTQINGAEEERARDTPQSKTLAYKNKG
jgi:hypothetical protein